MLPMISLCVITAYCIKTDDEARLFNSMYSKGRLQLKNNNSALNKIVVNLKKIISTLTQILESIRSSTGVIEYIISFLKSVTPSFSMTERLSRVPIVCRKSEVHNYTVNSIHKYNYNFICQYSYTSINL